MLDNIPRYDMQRPPMRQHLRHLIAALSVFPLAKHHARITKTDMADIKPPYLLLCNHNAFMDFMMASHAVWPHRANFVVAIDGFIHREWLLRFIGCICTRKFTSDLQLVKNLTKVAENGDIIALYPEARYSLCGTTAVLPDSLGKLAKLLKIPVVTLICHGHHINSPFYHLPDHGVKPTSAELKLLLGKEEVISSSADEINRRIREAFVYDDFRWQQDNHIRVSYKDRARGLHKVLYQCPVCGQEYTMRSGGARLWCDNCGAEWELDMYGKLSAVKQGRVNPEAGKGGPVLHPGGFDHVPDWYEWERENVRREVENGSYRFDSEVRVRALPNAKGYIDLGTGRLVHDMDGFHVEGICCGTDEKKRSGSLAAPKGMSSLVAGEKYRVDISPARIYSCHIEYDYLGRFGDCIDLNTNTDTLYIYPLRDDFSVTKIALATEELYDWHRNKKEQ